MYINISSCCVVVVSYSQAGVAAFERGDSVLVLPTAWKLELSHPGSSLNKFMAVSQGYSNVKVIAISL